MERVSTSTTSAVDPTIAGYAAGPQPAGWFSDGTPGVIDGTIPGAQWMNQVQEELVNAIEHDTAVVAAADVLLENQLATAIGSLKALRSAIADTTSITPTHLRANLAASASQATGAASVVAASDNGSVASGAPSAVIGSTAATASGTQSAAIASNGALVAGDESAAIASKGSTTAGSTNAAIIACGGSVVSGDATSNNTAVIASIKSGAGVCVANGEQSMVAASDNGQATGLSSVVLGSATAVASGAASACIASSGATASGDYSVVLGSLTATATANRAAVVASDSADADAANSAVIASTGGAYVTGTVSVLIASENAQLHSPSCVAAGDRGGGAIAKGAADQQLAWRASSVTGDFDVIAGAGFNVGAIDFAEYFENSAPGVLPHGRLVSRRGGRKVGLAQPGERVVGPVSACPGITGGGHGLGWHGWCETTEFGAPIDEMIEWVEWPQLTSTDHGPRDVAQAKLTAAAAAYSAAVEAKNHAHLSEQDKRKFLLGPSDAFRATTEQLDPWTPARKSWRRAPRLAENAHIWLAIEAAQAKMATADAEMRAHVAERVEAAAQAEAKTRAMMDRARAELAAAESAVTVTRDAYRGPLAECPTTPPDDANITRRTRRKPAAGYDPSRPYVPRGQRPEQWTQVGLTGQIKVATEKGVKDGDFLIAGKDGLARGAAKPDLGRRMECMEVVSPFDAARGYGIAWALVG